MILYSINNINTTKECTESEDDINKAKLKFKYKNPASVITSEDNRKFGNSKRADQLNKSEQMDGQEGNCKIVKKLSYENQYKFNKESTPRIKFEKLVFIQQPNQNQEPHLVIGDESESLSEIIYEGQEDDTPIEFGNGNDSSSSSLGLGSDVVGSVGVDSSYQYQPYLIPPRENERVYVNIIESEESNPDRPKLKTKKTPSGIFTSGGEEEPFSKQISSARSEIINKKIGRAGRKYTNKLNAPYNSPLEKFPNQIEIEHCFRPQIEIFEAQSQSDRQSMIPNVTNSDFEVSKSFTKEVGTSIREIDQISIKPIKAEFHFKEDELLDNEKGHTFNKILRKRSQKKQKYKEEKKKTPSLTNGLFSQLKRKKPKTNEENRVNPDLVPGMLDSLRSGQTQVDQKKLRQAQIANNVLGNAFFVLQEKKQSGAKSLIVNYKTQVEAPNHSRLKTFLNKYYLTIKRKTKEGLEVVKAPGFWYSVCVLPNGSIFFCKKKQNTKFDHSGPGIPLFFIFLKTLLIFMMIAFGCSIYMAYLNRKTYNNYKKSNEYLDRSLLDKIKKYMISTSISKVVSLGHQKTHFNMSNYPKKINFKCLSGTISTDLKLVKLGYLSYFRDVEDVENIWNQQCSDLGGLMTSMQHCEGQQECTIEYKPFWFHKECWDKLGISDTSTNDSESTFKYKGYLNIPCINASIDPANPDESIFDSYYLYAVLSFGLSVLFQVLSFWLLFNEIRFVKQYKQYYRTPDEYCLKLNNFPTHFTEVELCKYILQMFDRFAVKYKFTGNPIVDLKVVKSRKYLRFVQKADRQNLVIAKILLKYKQKRSTKFERSQMDVEKEITLLSEKIVSCQESKEEKKLRQQLSLLYQIRAHQEKLNKIKRQMFKESNIKSSIKCVFATFQRIKDRNFFLELLSKNSHHYLAKFSKKKKDELLRDDKLIYATAPSMPLNIKWQNYSYGATEKFFRRLFSWFVYIMLYLIRKNYSKKQNSDQLAIYTLYWFSQYKQKLRLDFAVCPNSLFYNESTENGFLEYYLGNVFADNELACFCFEDYGFTLDSQTLTQIGKSLNFCDRFITSQTRFNLALTIESFLMSGYTFIFDILYMWLSQIEAHNDRNSKKISYISKLFWWKFFVNGILPILSGVHLYYFGRYDDFTSEWFAEKGQSIQFTSYLRILALLFVGIVRYLLPRIIQFYDARFSFDNKKTRKETHQEYQEVYTNMQFDLELSYAESLTTIFLMVIYGFMMPLIIPASLLQLFVIYWRDKLLVSNTYAFFSHVDTQLHKYVRNLLIVAFFVSCFVNTWVFGNLNFFTKNMPYPNTNSIFNYFTFEEVDFFEYNTIVKGDNFENLDQYLGVAQLSKSGYISSFKERMSAEKLQRLTNVILLIYTALIILRWTFIKVAHQVIQARLKQGIKQFKSDASNAQFEDLIDQNEILERITLGEKSKGRDIPLVRLRELHRQRRLRLVRNFERKEKKEQIKSSKVNQQKSVKLNLSHLESIQSKNTEGFTPHNLSRKINTRELPNHKKQASIFSLSPMHQQTEDKNKDKPLTQSIFQKEKLNKSSNLNLTDNKIELTTTITELKKDSLTKNQSKKNTLKSKNLCFSDMLKNQIQSTAPIVSKPNPKEPTRSLIKKNSASKFRRANTNLKTLHTLKSTINKRKTMLDQIQKPFFTLSSYDFRLNPIFRDHFVGEVHKKYLKKYKEEQDEEYANAKNAAKGFFTLLQVEEPGEQQEKIDREEYDEMRGRVIQMQSQDNWRTITIKNQSIMHK